MRLCRRKAGWRHLSLKDHHALAWGKQRVILSLNIKKVIEALGMNDEGVYSNTPLETKIDNYTRL